MLAREYFKGKYKFILALNSDEFIDFLEKFRGCLIFRGRKSAAKRLFDNILFSLKKKFKKDPFVVLHKALDNILPLLSATQKKIGKNFQVVPSLASGNRRFVIMLDWILRKQRSKSNIIGIKIDDVSDNLIDAYYKKGSLIRFKQQSYQAALSGKHLLKYGKGNRRSLARLRRELYKKGLKIKKKKE